MKVLEKGSQAAPSRLATVGCGILAGSLLLSTQFASAQVAVPPGASPGAVEPRDFRTPRPALLDADQPTFSIPPVFERPLGVDEGDKVFVRGFVLVGVQDDAEAGITSYAIEQRVQTRFEELQTLLENLRVAEQGQEDVDPDGFSTTEKQQILDFIQRSLSGMDAEQQVLAYELFVNDLRLARLERDQGLTIGQLQNVANAVTKYYSDRGYFLARAIVPAQEVVDGIVTIRVLEGRLGRVVPEGNTRYREESLTAPFRDMIGKLVTIERMEEALLTLQSYPGLLLSGVFRPGAVVGTADLVLNVQGEDAFAANVRYDNHGTAFTGERRLIADMVLLNPFGGGDSFNLSLLKTFDPDNSLYGSFIYSRPLEDTRYRWDVSLGRNTFDVFDPVGGTNTVFGGISDSFVAGLDRHLTRSRTDKLWWRADLSRRRADTVDTSQNDLVIARDDVLTLGLSINSEVIDGASQTIITKSLRFVRGFDGLLGVREDGPIPAGELTPARQPTSQRFSKVTFDYSRLKSLTGTQTFQARFNAQWSEDFLSSLEQFAIGGPGNLRSLPTSYVLRDKGAFGALEYSVRAPGFSDKPAWGGMTWAQAFGVTLFVEHALGYYNYAPGETETAVLNKQSLGGAGIAFDLTLPWGIQMKLQGARLRGGERTPNPADPTEDDAAAAEGSQFWFEISKGF